jgi:hypothetical protein
MLDLVSEKRKAIDIMGFRSGRLRCERWKGNDRGREWRAESGEQRVESRERRAESGKIEVDPC